MYLSFLGTHLSTNSIRSIPDDFPGIFAKPDATFKSAAEYYAQTDQIEKRQPQTSRVLVRGDDSAIGCRPSDRLLEDW